MSILIKGIPLGGYEISIMKDGERYRARVDGIWCEVEEIPTTDTDSDTISRAKAIEALDKRFDAIPMEQTSEILMLRKDLRELPPAQPARIKGHWIESKGQNILLKKHIEKGETWRVCDKCGAGFMIGYQYECDKLYHETFHNFCPKCGADMREVTE